MPKNKSEKPAQTGTAKKTEEARRVALALDFGTLYVKVRHGQILKPVKATITLFKDLGHLYKIKGSLAISSSGYRVLNKVASVSLATPQKVIVDGSKQPNPYIERNPKTKLIETVHIRKIGIGYSPIGNIVAIDKTLCYNIKTYFLQSIQAKMKKVEYEDGRPTDKLLHPNCAKLGVNNNKPKEEGDWIFFEVEPPLGIWVNYSDPAILDCIEEHTQRQRFGDRIAQTIVERNILKDHPAISISTVKEKKKNGLTVAHVTVYGYRHELEPRNINEILSQAEKGNEAVEVQAETVDEVPPEEEEEAIKEAEKIDEERKAKKTPAEMEEPPPEYYEKKKQEELFRKEKER